MPSRVVCFICGSLGGEYGQLQSRPPPTSQGRRAEKSGVDAIKGAYFPFLEHHDPPQGCRPPDADGLVDSCRVCHAFLTQQWANYERSNTPAVKRLYWLKRLDDGQFTGAEMKLQGEYMAQVMGLQYQPASDIGGGVAPPQAVSPDSRDGFKHERGRNVSRDLDVPSQGKKRGLQEDCGTFGSSGGGGGVLDLSVSIKTEPPLAKQSRKLSRDSSSEKHNNVGSETRSSREPRDKGEKLLQPPSVKPELDEYMFICYTCGVERSGVAAKFVSSQVHAPGEPHFPFLARLAPYKGASPMTAQGVCRVCDLCFSSLCHQWLAYEQHGTPSSARIFRLNNLFFSNDASLSMSGSQIGGKPREEEKLLAASSEKFVHESPSIEEKQVTDRDLAHRLTKGSREDEEMARQDSLREVCYLCSQPWSPLKMCPLYTTPATSALKEEDQMFFPFIRELRRPQGARPLNPDGSVRVCISCSANLQAQWQHYQSDGTPGSKRRYSLLPYAASDSSPHTQSPPSQKARMEGAKSLEYSNLSQKPLGKSSSASKLSLSQPLYLDIGKDGPKSPNLQHPPRSSALNHNSSQHTASVARAIPPVSEAGGSSPAVPGNNSEFRQNSTMAYTSTPMPTSSSSSSLNTIPHPLQQAGERPKKVCFLCGEKCLSTKSQVIYGYPARHEPKNVGDSAPSSHTFPFFPFITSREPAPNAEPIGEDGGAITCAYCYYSLLNQWRDYEEGAKRVHPAESAGDNSRDSRWLRKYSLAEFACFVCGNLDVPRRSMRTLEVHKYGFLREHRAPPQALVMWGGECIGCCSWCHYSLTHQLAEYERLGLPPELRKYNWTVQQSGGQQQHHLDENSCDTQDSTQDNHWVSAATGGHSELNLNTCSEAEDSNHGIKGKEKPSTENLIGNDMAGSVVSCGALWKVKEIDIPRPGRDPLNVIS
ncbi:BTB/POZ domain-containing protein at5g03250-like [Plakobranchus ocellatus]|uniref:BTB/POZ domain-containing protein at5g03250-like n=1 Tax=Plakobranchus ocellatus TaxID=259542 RepID=A0AAV4CSA4_9GAST|nr:BTB/POZ domain-containing protein at5g03250-like [Plakobranchus ocellatus]